MAGAPPGVLDGPPPEPSGSPLHSLLQPALRQNTAHAADSSGERQEQAEWRLQASGNLEMRCWKAGRFSLGKDASPCFVSGNGPHLLGPLEVNPPWVLFAPGLSNSWGQHFCPGVGLSSRTCPTVCGRPCFFCQPGPHHLATVPLRGSWVGLEVSTQGNAGKLVLPDQWFSKVWCPNQEHQHHLET